MWIVSGFAAKHKVLNRESFPYTLSFSDELQKFFPSNDLMYNYGICLVTIPNYSTYTGQTLLITKPQFSSVVSR